MLASRHWTFEQMSRWRKNIFFRCDILRHLATFSHFSVSLRAVGAHDRRPHKYVPINNSVHYIQSQGAQDDSRRRSSLQRQRSVRGAIQLRRDRTRLGLCFTQPRENDKTLFRNGINRRSKELFTFDCYIQRYTEKVGSQEKRTDFGKKVREHNFAAQVPIPTRVRLTAVVRIEVIGCKRCNVLGGWVGGDLILSSPRQKGLKRW